MNNGNKIIILEIFLLSILFSFIFIKIKKIKDNQKNNDNFILVNKKKESKKNIEDNNKKINKSFIYFIVIIILLFFLIIIGINIFSIYKRRRKNNKKNNENFVYFKFYQNRISLFYTCNNIKSNDEIIQDIYEEETKDIYGKDVFPTEEEFRQYQYVKKFFEYIQDTKILNCFFDTFMICMRKISIGFITVIKNFLNKENKNDFKLLNKLVEKYDEIEENFYKTDENIDFLLFPLDNVEFLKSEEIQEDVKNKSLDILGFIFDGTRRYHLKDKELFINFAKIYSFSLRLADEITNLFNKHSNENWKDDENNDYADFASKIGDETKEQIANIWNDKKALNI